MTTMLKAALATVEEQTADLPPDLQISVASALLEQVHTIRESANLLQLAASSMADDWDNALDADYDDYDANYALQSR